jgi:hypothetical protein
VIQNFLKFFDAYSLRARTFAGVAAAIPLYGAAAILVNWGELSTKSLVAGLVTIALIYALSDFVRDQGARVEPDIYRRMGGKPSIVMMRRGDSTFDEKTKDDYRAFLAGKVGQPAPTAAEEAADLKAADDFYERCGIWLRNSTRDTKKFPILFNELVAYGYRRNLFGTKLIAWGLDVVVTAVCIALLIQPAARELIDAGVKQVYWVQIVVILHFLYLALAITRGAVERAARKYGRELILSCEALRGTAKPRTLQKASAGKTADKQSPTA